MRCRLSCLLFALQLPLSVHAATEALPDFYSFQLQARSAASNFNLPSGANIADGTADINDGGRVATRVRYPTGQPGDNFTRHVFVGSDGAGFVVSEGTVGSEISDPRVDPTGKVWFAANFSGGGGSAGVYRYDPGNLTTALVTALPAGTQTYTAPRGNALGQIGYRADLSGGKRWVSFAAGSVSIHASEVAISAGSPYSTLYPPSFDENQLLAGKVILAAGSLSQIRSIDSHGTAVILARSNAEVPASPYVSFDNTPVLSPSSGQVAFIADIIGGVRAVYRIDAPGTIVEIARAGVGNLSAIETFAPAINDVGLVAFRGVDSNGKQAIFVGDDSTLRRVIGRGDPVPTDLGAGQIDQDFSFVPAFSGGVAINANGDIAFTAALTPLGNNQIEWGLGVFVARAGTQLILADGFEGP